MKNRIIVNGASGKMGLVTCEAISADSRFELIAQSEANDNISDLIKKHNADIVVDFTSVNSAFDNTLAIIKAGAHPVIGTSGLSDSQISELQSLCMAKSLGGIIAPNFSIGAILMIRLAEQAAKYFPNVEIIEMHHNQKIDAPSGTAIKTAKAIEAARQEKPNSIKETIIEGSRGANINNIPVHAIRLPGYVASQECLFGGVGEHLSIRHDSLDRKCFMPGVLLACEQVSNLNELVYGLERFV